MVRLVSAKPPKIDGVEGGSATPSSTPTSPAPKVTNWEQVEERQQRRRGMPTAPVKPAPAPTTASPVRPDGATPPAPEPIKGEINPTRFGKLAMDYTPIPANRMNPLAAEFGGFRGRPLEAGRNMPPVLTPAQKIANAALKQMNELGSPNPIAAFNKGGSKGGKALFALMMAGMATNNFSMAGDDIEGGLETIAANYASMGYPPDVAAKMAERFAADRAIIGTVTDTGAAAIADASFMGASAVAGAGIGAMFFGIGAIPGAILGAGYGWAASRIAAGASQLLNIVELATSSNIPTINDFWIHDAAYNASAELSFQGALMAGRESVLLENQGRFLSDEDVVREIDRIETGHYATSVDVDPKYDDYKQFIQEGYFVYKDEGGRYWVDVNQVQQFLYDTVRMTQQDDMRSRLPKLTVDGVNFSKTKTVTDDYLADLWNVRGVMP